MEKIPFVYFGTPEFAVTILDELEKAGLTPSLIVTREDKPQGRKMVLTPPPVKLWAESRNIPILQPTKLSDPEFIYKLKAESYKLFVVASYGKIIPKEILDIPEHGTLNVHPSLLPKLRGPAPIQGAILEEEKTGVSIMLLDEEMDHGPILAQRDVPTPEWPPYFQDLENLLAHEGGKLLAENIQGWVSGEIEAQEQDHEKATYVKKIKKKDAEINLSDNPETNLRKIRAYSGSPGAFTFMDTKHGKIRVVITKARLENEDLVIESVIPEGRKEMSWNSFQNGFLFN